MYFREFLRDYRVKNASDMLKKKMCFRYIIEKIYYNNILF